MTAKDALIYFEENYPGKNIVCLPNKNPTEIICEIEPTSDHKDFNIAIAAIKESIPHFHKEAEELYEVLKGRLELFVENKKIILNVSESYTVKPGLVHYAKGKFTVVKVSSRPGWTIDDHYLITT